MVGPGNRLNYSFFKFFIMAIIKQGILGGLSGKVGNVVGASWKGIDYLRSLPAHVANPNTVGQQTTRKKMNLVVKFLKSCTAMVRIGFKGFAVKMSAFNAATSYNIIQGISGLFPELDLNYNALMVAQGNLAAAISTSVSPVAEGKVVFAWGDNSDAVNAHEGDVALLLVYNPIKGASVINTQDYQRNSLTATINLPSEWTGDTVQCYIGFADLARLSGTQPKDYTSNSVYAGSVVVI